MSKHPLEHKCVDCKGTGIYLGLGAPEDCQTCGGAGAFIGVKVDLPNIQLDPNNFPDWMKDHLDRISENLKKEDAAGVRGSSVTNIKAAQKAGMSPPRRSAEIDLSKTTFIKGKGAPDLQVGETVYVYDAGWYKGEAAHLYENMHGGQMVRVDDHSGGVFRIATKNICWNLTEDRWEYIRSGTPVW